MYQFVEHIQDVFIFPLRGNVGVFHLSQSLKDFIIVPFMEKCRSIQTRCDPLTETLLPSMKGRTFRYESERRERKIQRIR